MGDQLDGKRIAGDDWRDVKSCTCGEQGWTLVTSREPDDLDAFNKEFIAAFGG